MKFYIAEGKEKEGIPVELPCKPNVGEWIIHENGTTYKIQEIMYSKNDVWLLCVRGRKLEVNATGELVSQFIR